MCGITGIVDFSRRAVERVQESAERMCCALQHRGPDDWGVVTLQPGQVEHRSMCRPQGESIRVEAAGDQTVVLGHRRLSIIDLSSAGHQPMCTPDGRFWITYNGEIYNYRELRCGLEAGGVRFRSTSDTEVVLALYAREGPRCLQRLRGMFAFVIWDRQARELFLARDRFGIKPLYYAQPSPGRLLFASEMKALLSSGFVSPDINEESEIAFLRRGHIPPPDTLYHHIQALPPGQWARYDGRTLSIEPYWSLPEVISGSRITDDGSRLTSDVAAAVHHALIESVKAHLVSDVPVGVFLSSGVDSTALVAAIRQFYSGPLRTFTIVFPGTAWDEGRLARQAADYYATDHTELEVTKEDFFRGLDDVFSAMDQPTYDGVNTFFVARAVRSAGGKVALSGVGGDEVLGGYRSFVDVPTLHRVLGLAGRLPLLPRATSTVVAQLPVRWAPKLAQLLQHTPYELETVWRDYRAFFADDEIRQLGHTPVNGDGPRTTDRGSRITSDVFWSVARLEMERFMSPQLLRDSDVFTMCHGLELRTPFVDDVFLKAVLDAGAWSRKGASSYKLALFKSMNGFLPTEHLAQRKRTFTLPFELWLREALMNQSGSDRGGHLRSVLGRSEYRPFVEGFVQGNVHWSRIWSLYVLERFRAGTVNLT